MLEVISSCILFVITYIIDCFIFKKVLKSKIKILTKKNIALILLMSIIASFIDVNYTDIAKMLICNIQSCILLKLIFDDSLIHIIIFEIVIYIVSIIGETIFAFIFIMLCQIPATFFTDTLIGETLCNIGIMAIYYLIFQIKQVRKFVKWLVCFYNNNSKIESFFLLIFITVLIASITYPIIIHSYSFREMVTFSLIFIAAIYFITNFFQQRSKNGELIKEYDHLLDYVKEYEKALDEKSKNQHEYKNQLIVLRETIKKNRDEATEYINKLLGEKESKNTELLNSLKSLPHGGLKGLIYFKAERMVEKGMEVHINVDKVLDKKKLWNTCEQELQDISRIVGIYIDNAIEAADKSDKKYIIIDIEYENDSIIFGFSNTYRGHIEIDKLDKEGFSTKGKNRGYGLPLVQDIIRNNEYLEQEREMNGIFYVQKLIVKNK